MRLYTTHNRLKTAKVCQPGFERFSIREALVNSPGFTGDLPLPLALILEINGLSDALWTLRATPPGQLVARDRIARLFAADCAEHVLPIYLARHPQEWRPRVAIDAARRFAEGGLTAEEMKRAGLKVKQAPKTRASLAARATTKRIAYEAAIIAAQAAASAAADREAEREWQARRLMEYLTQGGNMQDWTCYLIKSSTRYDKWRRILQSDEIPIKSPKADLANFGGEETNVRVYELDIERLSEGQRMRLIEFIMERFRESKLTVVTELEYRGFPVRAEDVVIAFDRRFSP